VLATIEFDNDVALETDEIHDIRSHGHLTSEFMRTELTVSKSTPQFSLCVCRVLAKVIGSAVRLHGYGHRWQVCVQTILHDG
jgi:hypothetical protein